MTWANDVQVFGADYASLSWARPSGHHSVIAGRGVMTSATTRIVAASPIQHPTATDLRSTRSLTDVAQPFMFLCKMEDHSRGCWKSRTEFVPAGPLAVSGKSHRPFSRVHFK